MKTKFFSVILAIIMIFSIMATSAVAVDSADVVTLPNLSFNDSTYRAWDSWFSATGSAANYSTNICNTTYARGNYTVYTYSSVEQFVLSLNLNSDNSGYYFNIQPLENTAYYGIRVFYKTGSFGGGRVHSDKYTSYVTAWLTDNSNHAILCTSNVTGRLGKPVATPRAATASYYMLSYEDLYNLASDYNDDHSGSNYVVSLNDAGMYWIIAPRGNYVLGNESGLPYAAVGPQAVNGNNNARIVPTNDDVVNNVITDWTNQTVGDGNEGNIAFDGCIYDSSSKTYYYDSSTHFLNSFNETYYYSWSYTYNIDYTNITYIGSSAEYTETYDVYYTLPDGRSSADLTKEELEQLNLEIDVINYGRGTDDTRLRSLYHLDGNTEDASYWNYATSWDWVSGSSLTYLESNAFNGSLYLDELDHEFTLTLPSSLGSGDFTLDFRYYQSATLAPQLDSYITVGGQQFLQMNGSHFLFGDSSYATPVGNWNHLALVRSDGVLKFYLNGVQQGSVSNSSFISNQITFHFGTDQQTYKYLDEIRVTNFPVWTSNFTSPAVPYDTNLALVLPTDSVPVADEYWDITFDSDADATFDFQDNAEFTGGVSGADLVTTNAGLYLSTAQNSGLSSYNSFLSSTSRAADGDYVYFPFYDFTGSGFNAVIFSVLCSDGNTYSVSGVYWRKSGTYRWYAGDSGGYLEENFSRTLIPGGAIGYREKTANPRLCICIDSSVAFPSVEIVAVQIVVGDNYDSVQDARQFIASYTSSFAGEFVSSISGIPEGDLNTPTLAVRSEIPVTDYQIGGIRPTFAERGQVYAMVENGFISSLQIYTGYAWVQVDGRIWTGERWIPYSSYNVITLSDMYDIADASGQSGYEYIYTETGFWAWWQKSWLSFVELFKQSGGSGGGGTVITENTTNNITNNEYTGDVSVTNVIKESGKSMWDVISGLMDTLGGVFSETGEAVGGMTDALSEPEDDSSVWYLFDVPYEMMSPVGEGD